MRPAPLSAAQAPESRHSPISQTTQSSSPNTPSPCASALSFSRLISFFGLNYFALWKNRAARACISCEQHVGITWELCGCFVDEFVPACRAINSRRLFLTTAKNSTLHSSAQTRAGLTSQRFSTNSQRSSQQQGSNWFNFYNSCCRDYLMRESSNPWISMLERPKNSSAHLISTVFFGGDVILSM